MHSTNRHLLYFTIESLSYVWHCLCHPMCLSTFVQCRLVTDGQTDGRTNRQTDGHTVAAYDALVQRQATKNSECSDGEGKPC